MTQSSRPPLWYFFPLIALAIFLNKPFHIDDTLFLNIGRILPWSILGDSMGDISFLGRVYQDLSPYESTHPPLIPYFLKLIGAGFDQYAPFWLYHLFFLVFPFLVLVEGWNLSKRKNVSPVWTWFLVFSPLFFVNATNLMTDIAMLCFWLGGIASIIAFCEDGTRKHALKAMGYLTGAFFTSYQSICLVPLLILYILVNGERKRRSLLLLAAPTVVFFVYLVLAAQYESFVLPLAVLFSLPIGIFGTFLLLKLMGLANDVYAQIGMIMLVGLLGKNAVLIVEFAIQKHNAGATILDAAIEGAKVRFRPILMTSFAFIAGLIPLVMASGAGAIGNRTIGSASLGGMLVGTLFGVLIIPGLYYTLAKLVDGKVLLQGESHIPVSESFVNEPTKASLLKKISKLNVLLQMQNRKKD